jgi:hypothetical protein
VSDEAPFRRDGDRFAVELPPEIRRSLRAWGQELRGLVTTEDPSSDASLQRLFPPAYPDDLLQNLDYEESMHDELRDGRISSAEMLIRTADETSLSEEELLAWMRTCNDLRLVLGTRLDLTEETAEENFADDEQALATYRTYALLSVLVETIVEALGSDES